MSWQTIAKSARDWALIPNLADYERARQTFTWENARKELDGLPGGQGLNIAYEAVDRHANGPLCDHLAIRWLGKNGQVEDFTYGQLQTLTNRFANVLQHLGVSKGDRVYVLAGRIPELYVAALGDIEARMRLLSSILGLWPGAHSGTRDNWPGKGTDHNRVAL